MVKKKCDLCNGVARMYCESDQASLCWDCDGKVHGANFLVAKHTRCLLCTTCHSLTPWKANGLRLSPTFSVCDSCLAVKNAGLSLSTNRDQESNVSDHEEDRISEYDGDGAESYDDDEEEDESDDDYSDDEDEETENQVVPWAAVAQPIPVMSSSSEGEGANLMAKRRRDEDIGCSSAQESNYSQPLKRPSRDERVFKSTAVVNSILRLDGEREREIEY